MRYVFILLSMVFGLVPPAAAQFSLSVGLPGVSIGVNVPIFPELVRVPGYPVYYAPGLQSNFFFYDGMYWVYQGDEWYASTWYNGPWGLVAPEAVPLFVLRIPVRYYRSPPVYFRGWQPDAPPRWGEHWGNGWQQRRPGWDQWDRRAAPAPAPLPAYQRQYPASRYPQQIEQQQALRSQNYRYQPRDTVVRQHFQESAPQQPPAQQRPRQSAAPAPQPNAAPREQRPPDSAPRAPAYQDHGRPAAPEAAPREKAQRKPDQDKERDSGDERGGERKR